MQRIRWIGIFGGSFNPPHVGHLLAAVYALKMFELDEVWFVPAWRHAFSKDLRPFNERMELCRRLIRGLGPAFGVSDVERRIRSDGKTLKTLLALRKKHPDCVFSLIVGSDVWPQRKRWYRFDEIERRFLVLTVPRAPWKVDGISIPDVSSSEIRRRIESGKPLQNLLTPEVEALFSETASIHPPPRSSSPR